MMKNDTIEDAVILMTVVMMNGGEIMRLASSLHNKTITSRGQEFITCPFSLEFNKSTPFGHVEILLDHGSYGVIAPMLSYVDGAAADIEIISESNPDSVLQSYPGFIYVRERRIFFIGASL